MEPQITRQKSSALQAALVTIITDDLGKEGGSYDVHANRSKVAPVRW